MKHFPYSITLLIALLQTSCDKCEGYACFTPPEELRFKVVSPNSKLIDTVYASYLDKGITKFVPLTKSKTPKNESYFNSNNLAFIANSPTEFTLFVNDKKEGVLSIYEKEQYENCCTYSKLDRLQFENQSILTTLDEDNCYKITISN